MADKIKAYHASPVKIDAFKPSKFRGSTFFASSPNRALNGAHAGMNEMIMDTATESHRGPLNVHEVSINPEEVRGLHYTPKEKAWFDRLPKKVIGDQALEKLFTKEYQHIPWDDVYDHQKIGDRLYQYNKKNGPPSITYEQAYKTGRDVYGDKHSHYGAGADEKAAAQSVLKDGMKGYLVHDEGGLSIAMADPSNVKVNDIISKAEGGSVDDFIPHDDPRRQENFQNWFGGSHPDLQNEDGTPKTLFIGTLSDFDTFNRNKMNPEGDHGQGFYATSSSEDANENYAHRAGPDLSSKIERKMDEFRGSDMDEEYSEEELRKMAQEELGVEHHGAVMPVHMALKNPVVLGGKNETDYDFHQLYNEELDEYEEPTGSLMKLIEGVNEAGLQFDHPTDEIVNDLIQHGMDYGVVPATKTEKIIKKGFQHAYDENGNLASNEAWRTALEEAGHDGIIDHTVDSKFGSNRRGFAGARIPGMSGVKPDTTHYVAFDSSKIKSATGNIGQFSPQKKRITENRGGTVDDEDEGLTAYHGSPHDFERFDINKIGTGEGAQAYGHGLYFAESEPVAKGYRDRLTDKTTNFRVGDIDMPKWILRSIESAEDRNAAIEQHRQDFSSRLAEAEAEKETSHQPWMVSGRISTAKDILAGLDQLQQGAPTPHTKGRMYEVRINAHPEHFLDWDKPLNQQSSLIQSAIKSITGSLEIDPFEHLALAASIGQHPRSQEYSPRGNDLYNDLEEIVGDKKKVSDLLRQHGLKGIQYLDAGSRNSGEGSRNYVVFDHDLVKVKRKYARGGSVAQS
jgi:hypothetical protein